MLSVGERPWRQHAAATFARYGRLCGADFRLETDYPSKAELPIKELAVRPGRKAKLAYASKIYFAWKYLTAFGYDRVLFVDDTCCIRPAANLFDLLPRGLCGYTKTSRRHAAESFAVIRGYLDAEGLPEIDFDPDHYMNGGLILYDKAMAEALCPERICAAADLLYAQYPHQTLLYYLLKRQHIPLQALPKAFNTIPGLLPGRKLASSARFEIQDIRPYLSDEVFAYHVTAGFRHRADLIEQIATLFLAEWEAASPASLP